MGWSWGDLREEGGGLREGVRKERRNERDRERERGGMELGGPGWYKCKGLRVPS